MCLFRGTLFQTEGPSVAAAELTKGEESDEIREVTRDCDDHGRASYAILWTLGL